MHTKYAIKAKTLPVLKKQDSCCAIVTAEAFFPFSI